MNDWIYGMIENYIYNNYIEDEELDELSIDELDKIVKKIYNCILDDVDLENDIKSVVQDGAEWYYSHEIKKGE